MTTFRYIAVRASQAEGKDVVSFSASPADILAFADIDRVGRDEKGKLRGFQRHQIASHIKEIRDYLSGDDAILPNPIVLAFIDGVKIAQREDGLVEVLIEVANGKPG